MKKVWLLLLAGLGLLACEKSIDLDIPLESPKIVLHSYLNPDSSIMVQLSKSALILETLERKQPISGATVRVFEEGKDLGTLQYIDSGFYRLQDIYPKPGKTYRIEAEMEGMEKITAIEKALEPIEIFDFKIDTVAVVEDDWGMDKVEVEISFLIKDPPGDNFYMSKAFYHYRERVVHKDGTEEIWQGTWDFWDFGQGVSDPALESFCSFGCVYILKDTYFEGRQYEFRLGKTFAKPGTNVIIEENGFSVQLYNVSKSYYLYYATIEKKQESIDDPFAEPTRIYTNVEGGYGLLGAFTISTARK